MSEQNRRVLLIDDTPSIHEDFRKILAPAKPGEAELEAAEKVLFGKPVRGPGIDFEFDSAMSGREGVDKAQAALACGRPYALAFVDMRMPPGWDGVETVERLWRTDPQLQVVICTAYSDHPWDTVMARLDVRDRLLVLKKPFDPIEVSQLARTLTAKWDLSRQAALQIESLARAMEDVQASETALRRSHRRLETFAHSLSHDLRAPLTAMSSFSQLLANELKGSAAGKGLHYLSRIRANAGIAEQLINDLLFLEGVSRAELNREPVELGALARELLQELQDAEPQRTVTLSVDDGLWTNADRNLATIAMRHLLMNAWRFSSQQAPAVIEVGKRDHAGAGPAFFVRDNGQGFDMTYADKLFHSPQRLHQDAGLGGTGVGLMVVDRIVSRHGGGVWFDATAGAGATFFFSFQPRAVGVDVQAGAATADERDLGCT